MIEAQREILVSTKAKARKSLLRRIVVSAGTVLAASAIVIGSDFAPTAYVSTVASAESLPHPVGFAEIVKKVKPAVISVRVQFESSPLTSDENLAPFSDQQSLERFFRRFFGLPEEGQEGAPLPRRRDQIVGQGSGFFISADGYAVTNRHVVSNTKTVEITTDDGKRHPAKVIGADPRTDIALIKVDGDHFPFVKFADARPQIGDWVLAVGNPFGLGGTVTAGIVSAEGRDIGAGPYDDFIQIDAPVNRGNSGGPTFDVEGNVIGVNAAIFSPSGGSVGIAFAVPSETVKAVISQLKEKGSVTRGWIGVQIQQVTPEIAESLGLKKIAGALVAEPQSDGPAAKAGIESGDVIVSVNGKEVADARDLARTISSMSPGTAVRIGVLRKEQEKTFNLTLGTLPEEREAKAAPEQSRQRGTAVPELGLSVAARPGADGVVVSNVDTDGLAAERGIKTGDVILEVAGKKVRAAADMRNAIDAAKKEGKRSALMQLRSGDGMKFVAVPISRG